MKDSMLNNITHREIILNLILLKPGKRNFLVTDLKKGLDAVSVESPRLNIPWSSIRNTFFFYDCYLHGEFNLPHYRLSDVGQKIIQREFNTYTLELQQRLKDVAKKVWQYNNN